MAVDKLVDSTKLNACCTAEANAIRAKTGGLLQINYDWANNKGFADAIAAIPNGSGGSDLLAKLLENTLTSYDITTDTIKLHTFRGATSLTSVTFPFTLISVGDYAFTATRLQTAVLYDVGSMGSNAFSNIPTLTAVDIGSLGQIYTSIFSGDSAFNVLVLRGSTITTLRNINAFANTPFANGGSGGTLYVPSSLISEYQAATNWSTILGYANNSIQSIESSIYATQYVDGTPKT